MKKHLCQSCGACCAFFRVSFHWTETSAASHGVPANLTMTQSAYMNAMSGTEKTISRCTALKGTVAKSVACTIYENRPSPCRAFGASFENGVRSEDCEKARSHHGLPALTLASWSTDPGAVTRLTAPTSQSQQDARLK